MKFLDLNDILNASLVCSEWLALCRDDSFWVYRLNRDFSEEGLERNQKKYDKTLFFQKNEKEKKNFVENFLKEKRNHPIFFDYWSLFFQVWRLEKNQVILPISIPIMMDIEGYKSYMRLKYEKEIIENSITLRNIKKEKIFGNHFI